MFPLISIQCIDRIQMSVKQDLLRAVSHAAHHVSVRIDLGIIKAELLHLGQNQTGGILFMSSQAGSANELLLKINQILTNFGHCIFQFTHCGYPPKVYSCGIAFLPS